MTMEVSLTIGAANDDLESIAVGIDRTTTLPFVEKLVGIGMLTVQTAYH
jgi:hypothetical protein